ncbi:response regulator [Desulfonatronum lacustre]|uniref:response regulator n=1 Tax=Desulfonatronum lacustre TaxID=66849 RepID=UPI00048C8F6B|nr:response regulator [Desulfonatronum lacustre]SMP39546.1 HDIG domain-containing protein [Desulfonatronum zhilinae]
MNDRILFVDDNPSVLRGLRRMLLELEDTWQMHFAESGEEALAMMDREPFDVIVSDLQMPLMNGTELLERVRSRSPGTVRLILSGYSDNTQILKSAMTAHQFLSKPSSREVIQSALERVLALQEILPNPAIREVVARLFSLPVLPSTYDELMRATTSGQKDAIDEVAGLVSRDLGLSASILKLVNTAFFGLPQHIDNPARAVSLLGIEIIKALIVSGHFISPFNPRRHPGFALEDLWTHSRNTARFAETIARLEGADQKTADQAYLGGLFHDVGKLVLACAFEDEFHAIIDLANTRNITIIDAEREVISVSHVQIGAYLLGLWGFDEHIVHGMLCQLNLSAREARPLTTAVHAANALEHELRIINPGYATHPVDTAYLEHHGLTGRYEVWREACRNLITGK